MELWPQNDGTRVWWIAPLNGNRIVKMLNSLNDATIALFILEYFLFCSSHSIAIWALNNGRADMQPLRKMSEELYFPFLIEIRRSIECETEHNNKSTSKVKWTKTNRPRYSIVLANESCVSFFSPNIIADLIKIFRCSFDGKIAPNKKLSIYYIVLYSHCLRLKSKYWRAQCAPCWRTSHLSINNGSLRLNLLCAWKILTKWKKNHSETDFLADAEKPKLITISSKLNFLLGVRNEEPQSDSH